MCFCSRDTGSLYCNSEKCQNEMVRKGKEESLLQMLPIFIYGWICPRCQRVHSPNIITCQCNR